MKIGIGVITAGVRTVNPNIHRFAPADAFVHVEVDRDRTGVAPTRNRCLKAMMDADCDFLFLFDDDCYPCMPGWAQYFVQQSIRHGLHYLTIPEAFKSTLVKIDNEMAWWSDAIGCFCMQTRFLMDRVGYYNSAYDTYGSEDVARNIRIRRAGLVGMDGFPSPIRSLAFIHSEDVFAENPTPNLSHDQKLAFIAKNESVFRAEIQNGNDFYDSDGRAQPRP